MPPQNTFKSKLRVEIRPLCDVLDIKPCWRQLEKYSSSIFLSWTWIGSWLSTIKDKSNVYSINFYTHTNKLVGAAFLTKDKVRRRKVFTLNIISLNETITNDTQFIIEYNNILYNPDYKNEVFYSFFDFLRNGHIRFDELQLHAFDINHAPDLGIIARSYKFYYLCEKISKVNFVDFGGLTGNPDAYLPTLSKNKREQIRRSVRFFEKFGNPDMEIASSRDQALKFFDAMGRLHQAYWTSKGCPGSFSNDTWIEFHKHLITNNPDNIQLIKLSFGDHIVGYLYNFIDNTSVYSIQSGFNYGKDKNNRPGLVLHYYAIRHAISSKRQKYDFLVDDTQYKRSLSNAFNICSWIQIQNKTPPVIIENMSVKCYRFLKATLKPITATFLRSTK